MCNHEKLRAVGDRLFCAICKEELPMEFLTGEKKPASEAPKKEPARKKTAKKEA